VRVRSHLFPVLTAVTALAFASTAHAAGAVKATFTIKNAGTAWGQSVYVVGDVDALGKWDPGKGLALKMHGSGKNATWTGSTSLPAGSPVQYKYVKWDGKGADWEGDQSTKSKNREVHTPASGTVTFDDHSFRKPKAN